MRLNELNYINDYKKTFDIINKNCTEYISANPEWQTLLLYRGIHLRKDFSVEPIDTDRSPMDTPTLFHQMSVDVYKKLGIKARRDNSIFCTKSANTAKQYGPPHVIIPFNGYSFSQLKGIRDFTESIEKLCRDNFIILSPKDPNMKVGRVLDLRYYTSVHDIPNIDNILITNAKQILNTDDVNLHSDLTYEQYLQLGNTIGLTNDQMTGKLSIQLMYKDVKVDTSAFTELVKNKIKTVDITKALKGSEEILISGSKYLAVNYKAWPGFINYVRSQHET